MTRARHSATATAHASRPWFVGVDGEAVVLHTPSFGAAPSAHLSLDPETALGLAALLRESAQRAEHRRTGVVRLHRVARNGSVHPSGKVVLAQLVERRGKAVELEWGGNRGWFFLETGSMVHPPSRGPRWCLDPIDAAELLRCASKPHEK
jgi:hypothetical protein